MESSHPELGMIEFPDFGMLNIELKVLCTLCTFEPTELPHFPQVFAQTKLMLSCPHMLLIAPHMLLLSSQLEPEPDF
jgi:hypothetical protein